MLHGVYYYMIISILNLFSSNSAAAAGLTLVCLRRQSLGGTFVSMIGS